MALPLSTTAILEKNKLANSDSVFLVLLEITVPGLSTPIRVVSNTENINWQGQVWQAFPFELDEIGESMNEVPRVEIRVSNVSREMELYLHEYDRWCKINGYEPITCKIFVVNSLNLDQPGGGEEGDPGWMGTWQGEWQGNWMGEGVASAYTDPEVEHEFILLQPKTSAQWASFTLGASNPWNRRYPQRRLIPSCQWRFKGAECQYSGASTECNKSLSRCKELGNTARHGGYYAIGRPN